MRLIVTGSEGYIGSVLCRVLLEAGHDVRGIDSGLFHDCLTGTPPPVKTLDRDIRDLEAADLADADAVIHLAALSNDLLGDIDEGVTREINHHGAVRVAECAKRAGVPRFVMASSCSVYGAAGDDFLNEDSATGPLTPYAESKIGAELDVLPLADAAFRPVVLRPGTVYGASARVRFDLVVNNLVAWAVTSGEVLLKSLGTAWRPLIHVEDLARFFFLAATVPTDRLGPSVFNVGRTDENFRILDLAERISAAVAGSRLTFQPGACKDERSYRVDCSRLVDHFPEFRFLHGVSDGIPEVQSLVRDLKLSPDDFEGAGYLRSSHLLALRDSDALDETFRWRQGPRGRSAVPPARQSLGDGA
ncbi:MAG: SDR family oxidoreductase [Alphaproteobacteria bacterium]|nr:SDR family oxidoreductase [Alphaproteobacteria bacterium]